MEDGINILVHVRALLRRWWIIGLIAGIGTAIAVGIALKLPPVYESTARILVESQAIPDDLARSTVTADAAERLELIKQRLMTRDNLLDVIERLNLFRSEPDLSATEKVARLRQATTIRPISFNKRRRRDRAVSAFLITYRSDNPRKAAQVANEFVTLVLEQNLVSRERRASETHTFFRQEVDRLSAALLSLETKIAVYKKENETSLPDSLSFRHDELANIQDRLFARQQRRLELEEQRRALLEAQAAGQVVPVGERALSPEEQQLAQLRRTLTQKRGLYADTHPEIRSLLAQIAAVERLIQPTARNAAASEADRPAAPGTAQIDRQINLLQGQLDILDRQDEADEARKAILEKSIGQTPEVEMALSAFERQYDELKAQYQLAVRRRAEAATGERLEINQQAERFEIIEQAQVPEKPIAPARKKIAFAGAGLSLGAGVTFALLLEMLFGTVHNRADVERLINGRVLASIPYIQTQREARRQRRRWPLRLLFLFVILPVVLWLVDQFYLPLELIWNRFVENADVDTLLQAIGRKLS